MAPKFSLQTVLDVRHSKVESLEIELGKLHQEAQQKETVIKTMESVIENLKLRLHELMVGDIDLFMINHLRSNVNDLSEQLKSVQVELAELQVRIEAKRKEVVAARQAEETLGILKNKEIERFNAEQVTIEKRLQDDIYIAKGYQRH
jgi:flagellar export protein FliJ